MNQQRDSVNIMENATFNFEMNENRENCWLTFAKYIIDAYGAQQLVKILLRLTKQGTTILCTIHQPSSQLFAMFHKVLLLADGRISFIGSPHEAITFFSL